MTEIIIKKYNINMKNVLFIIVSTVLVLASAIQCRQTCLGVRMVEPTIINRIAIDTYRYRA